MQDSEDGGCCRVNNCQASDDNPVPLKPDFTVGKVNLLIYL